MGGLMPIYEFRCNGCRRRTSVFARSMGAPIAAVCGHCGSSDLARLFSRVAVLRTGDDFGSGIDESSLGDVDENDPRSMSRWIRKMSREAGEPLDSETESQMDLMEAGELPDDFDDGDAFEDDFAGV